MNKIFYKATLIKKFSALLLLFIFALGITPKKILHTLFANHKDSTTVILVEKAQQFSKAGFSCNCNDLVAESQFITFGSYIVILQFVLLFL